MAASIIEGGTVNGHSTIYLQNDRMRVGVLPGKGGHVFELLYMTGAASVPVECLMHTPWGLKAPGAGAQADFLENYEGG